MIPKIRSLPLAIADSPNSYAAGLSSDGLKGMRIGVLRLSLSKDAIPEATDFKEVRAILGRAAQKMAALGAEVIDPLEVPGLFDLMQAAAARRQAPMRRPPRSTLISPSTRTRR